MSSPHFPLHGHSWTQVWFAQMTVTPDSRWTVKHFPWSSLRPSSLAQLIPGHGVGPPIFRNRWHFPATLPRNIIMKLPFIKPWPHPINWISSLWDIGNAVAQYVHPPAKGQEQLATGHMSSAGSVLIFDLNLCDGGEGVFMCIKSKSCLGILGRRDSSM